jgi:myosin-5
VKAGLAELEHWCYKATDEVSYCTAINFSFLSIIYKYILTSTPSPGKKKQYAGPAWDELKHIRQAIGFLVFIYLQSAWYMFKWSE